MSELSLIVICMLLLSNMVWAGFYGKVHNRVIALERINKRLTERLEDGGESTIMGAQYRALAGLPMPQVKPPRKELKDVEIANLRSILKTLVMLDDNDVYTSEPWTRAFNDARLVLNQE